MKLFEPITVGGIELKNRIMYPPTVSKRADWMTGFVTEDMKDFYLKVAKGGAGIVVVEMTFLWPPIAGLLGIHHDGCIPGLKEMVDQIHAETDAKVFIQIGDHLPGMINTEDMRIEMIEGFVAAFKDAAVRAKKAGFDGIEVHGAHSYVLASFLSHRNSRKDEYGKTLDGRMKLIVRVIEECRNACGKDYPIGVRINGDEFLVGGNTLHQTRRIAPRLAALDIAYLSISVGGKNQDAWHVTDSIFCFPYPTEGPWNTSRGYSGHRCVPPSYMPEGVNVYIAADLRKHVRAAGLNTPIITVGKISSPKFAESVLQEESADMVALCRAILCDHQWPNKVKEGRAKEIVKCMYCNRCFDVARLGGYTACRRWKEDQQPNG